MNFLKNIFGDLFTSASGTALGLPVIKDGIETLPSDKSSGILKIVIGVGTLLLGLLTTSKNSQK